MTAVFNLKSYLRHSFGNVTDFKNHQNSIQIKKKLTTIQHSVQCSLLFGINHCCVENFFLKFKIWMFSNRLKQYHRRILLKSLKRRKKKKSKNKTKKFIQFLFFFFFFRLFPAKNNGQRKSVSFQTLSISHPTFFSDIVNNSNNLENSMIYLFNF